MDRGTQGEWSLGRRTCVLAAAFVLGVGAAPNAFADDGVGAPILPAPIAAPAIVVPLPPLPPAPVIEVALPSVPPPVVPRAGETASSQAIPPVVSSAAPAAEPVTPVPATPAAQAPAAPPQSAQPAVLPPSTAPTATPGGPDASPPATVSADTGGNTASGNSPDITSQTPTADPETSPTVWIWNWSWNCDPSTVPAVPSPPPGSTVWVWNWQWDCPGGAPAPTASVPSVCNQCNIAVSIRVGSPGDNGDVTQTNAAVSSAAAANAATTGLGATQAAAPASVPAVDAFRPPPVPSLPGPIFTLPPIPPPPTVDVQRELAGAVPTLPAPAAAAGDSQAPSRAAVVPFAHEPKSVVRRRFPARSRTLVQVDSRAFTRVVVVERSREAARPRVKTTARTRGAAAQPLPTSPRAPLLPSSPAAAGAPGASGHGGGGSVLTVSLIGGLTFLAFALLSSTLPAALPGRRRLSDDRRARPG